MLGIALTLESDRLPIWPAIVLSYVLFAAAMFWSVGCWLASNTVIRLNPRTWNRVKRRRTKGDAWFNYRFAKWSVAILISAVFAIAIWATYETNYLIELRRLGGILKPASDPTPAICKGLVGKNEVLLIYGSHGNGAVVQEFPHVVLRSLSMGDVISLDRLQDGSIAVLMDVKDPDGKVIARLDRNGFIVNANKVLSMDRPDKSTLIVTDEYGMKTLNIRYLNSQAIKIEGAFHYPGETKATPFEMRGAANICTKAFGSSDFGIR